MRGKEKVMREEREMKGEENKVEYINGEEKAGREGRKMRNEGERGRKDGEND